MKSFSKFLQESNTMSVYKKYVSAFVRKKGKKITSSSRGGVHIRFPIEGNIKDFQKFFKPAGIEVSETAESISGTFETFLLTQVKAMGDAQVGFQLLWVNNVVGAGTKADKIFNTKELSPDGLGVAGKTFKADKLIKQVAIELEKKYGKKIAEDLTKLMKQSKQKKETIKIDKLEYNSKDLATISKDFGEILAAIWSQYNLTFRESYFPSASNEKLIDFYGVRLGINYPISVKSGGGGKVTIQNIIDAINNRAKTRNADHSKEKSLRVFHIVNNNSAKPAMILLHQEMETKAIKTLGKIMKMNWKNITFDNLKTWLDQYTNEELKLVLKPFHNELKTKITDAIWNRNDKLRFVISPLGESIWKILNNDREIKESLTNVARQVMLIQVNIDVKSSMMKFKSNHFKEAEFEFGWAGYAAGNKLGFKMKLKN